MFQDVALFPSMACFRPLEIYTDMGGGLDLNPHPGAGPAMRAWLDSSASCFNSHGPEYCQQGLVLEPSIKMAYFTVSNKVLATEPFSGASGHYTGEDDRESLSIKLRASQSLSRATVLSAQV